MQVEEKRATEPQYMICNFGADGKKTNEMGEWTSVMFRFA